MYFYYYSDALLTICLFFALMGLYSQVFKEMGAAIYVRHRRGYCAGTDGCAFVSRWSGIQHLLVTRFRS